MRSGRTVTTLLSVVLLTAVAACATRPRGTTVPGTGAQTDSIVRILLGSPATNARLASTTMLTLVDGRSGLILGTAREGNVWTARAIDADGIELTRPGSQPVIARNSPLLLRVDSRNGFLIYEGRRFRGSMLIWREGERVAVVNHVPVEDYLLGVVPLEIGTRRNDERAAVEAQAISARSFTYARTLSRRRDTARRYDLSADVNDQAYGGVDAENGFATQQVVATRRMVVKFRDRIIETVYSASCGGATQDAATAWPFGGQPYLRSVSDAIPGGGGSYCDINPRATWSSSPSTASLVAGIDAYLRNYTNVNGRITAVDSIKPLATSPSGRVERVALVTNAGRYELAGDRIRFVLRPLNGEVLRSTTFSIASSASPTGEAHFDISGRGNGHGVGMCQWGAIGRARAGQSAKEILEGYFVGAVVAQL